MTKLIFGGGYLGMRVARRWRDAGAEVTIATRSAAKAEQLAHDGFQTILVDVTRSETMRRLPSAQTILYSIGFDRRAGGSVHEVYARGVKNVLATLSEKTERLIYISTTGVYGPPFDPCLPLDGPWVNESSHTRPQRPSAKASLAAECSIASHGLASRAILLRVAGLYGPGRIPHQHQLRAGMPLALPSKGWMNLIHADDAATAVVEADCWTCKSDGPHIVCVSDGHPVVRGDYYREVARLMGLPDPDFIPPEVDSPAAIRATSNKRVSNAKMVRELGVHLIYPSYREGLAAILLYQL